MNFKILVDYKRFSIADLLAFVMQLISKTDGVAKYKAIQKQVDIVKLSYDTFVKAVDAASDGGKTLTLLRTQQKMVLIKDLGDLVLLTQLHANGDEAYATGAGFNTRAKPQRSNLPFPKPVLKYLRRGVKSGTVEGELKDFPKGVKEFSLLHSTDGGVTKSNGTSTSGKRFILDLGITEQRVQVSGYFLGTFQRKSDECDAMEVFVL